MTTASIGDDLRKERISAGLTQRELAARADIPQPNIAAYEAGRRIPTPVTVERLESVMRVPTMEKLQRLRPQVMESAKSHHLSNVRVFGSVARGQAGKDSDIDILVHPAHNASLFDLAAFMDEVQQIVGAPVDVVSDQGTGPVMDRIRKEAAPL